jgi:hypothetical protein
MTKTLNQIFFFYHHPGLITNVNLPEKTIGNLKENLKRKERKPLGNDHLT